MMNEEIEKSVAAILVGDWHEFTEGDLNLDEHVDEKKLAQQLRKAMRSLAVQAYEEAAQAVENSGPCSHAALAEAAHHRGVINHAADVIRALKDELEPVPNPSAPLLPARGGDLPTP